MAEELLVKEVLTPEMIKAGRDLIMDMEKRGSLLRSAFWFFDPDRSRWRLILSSPDVETRGPRFGYELVNETLKERTEIPLTLEEISVVPPRDGLVSALSKAVNTRGGILGIRFSRNSINGLFIQDAYIYKS